MADAIKADAGVVDFAAYKKRKEGGSRDIIWQCGECEGNLFYVVGDSTLECSECGQIIANITHDGGKQ